MEQLANVGIAIAAIAALGLLAMTVVVTRAAVRGKQTTQMARTIFALAGVMLIGGALVSLSVPLDLARAAGAALLLMGLAVASFATAAWRSRAKR
jgi:hypothetical protein